MTSAARWRTGLLVGLLAAGVAIEADQVGAGAAAMSALAASIVLLMGTVSGARRSIKDSEARFRSLTALSADWYWEQDREFRFTAVGGSVVDLCGQPADSHLGKARWELPSLNMGEADWAVHRAQLAAHAPFHDLEICRADTQGRERWASVSGEPVFDARQRFCGYRGIARDITDRKLAEQRLRASEAAVRSRELRLKGLIDSAMDAVISADAQHRIVLFNPAAERMFGYTAATVLGRPLDELLPERHRARHGAHIDSFRHTGDRSRYMLPRGGVSGRRADGSEFEAEASISKVERGGETTFTIIMRDITERNRAEQRRAELESQLRQAHKMEALGTMASGIAHDFNNVLAAIVGHIELARLDAAVAPGLQAHLKAIEAASRHGREMVRQILAFSRLPSQAREVVDVAVAIDEAAMLLRANLPDGVELRTHVSSDVPQVLADPTQLHQVLTNLGLNAAQAIGAGPGRIDIEAVAIDPPVAGVALPLGRYVRLCVADNGVGMDETTRARIFDPFFSTKPIGLGTGLGLAVVHGIVKGHGGGITVESEPGRGSRFSIYLPLAAADAVSDDDSAPAILAPGRGHTVCFLDDDEPLVLIGEAMLRHLGYTARGFTSADAAIAAHRAEPLAFDVLVSDVNLPAGSGLDVVRVMRETRPDLPVVLMSGLVSNTLRAQAEALGVRALVHKPYTLDELGGAVHRALAAID